MADMVRMPAHYMSDGNIETIDVVEAVIDGLPAQKALALGHVLRYALRAGKKTEDATEDLAKANNYAWRLVTGKWRHEAEKYKAFNVALLDGEVMAYPACPRCKHDVSSVFDANDAVEDLFCPRCGLRLTLCGGYDWKEDGHGE